MARTLSPIVPYGMQKLFDKWYAQYGNKVARTRCARLIPLEIYEELVRRRQRAVVLKHRAKERLDAKLAETDGMTDDDAVSHLHGSYGMAVKRAEDLIWKRRHGKR